MLKMGKLNKSAKERAYHEILHRKYEVLGDGDIESVDKE